MKLLSLSDERRKLEKEFVFSSDTTSLTIRDKEHLYGAREGLKFLPQFGKDGGILTKIASTLNTSRAHVNSTLFPKKVESLFGTSPMQRQIWAELAREVYSHHLYKPMKEAFTAIESDGQVILKARKGLLNFFVNRCEAMGIEVVILATETTSPRTYHLSTTDQ